MDKCNLIQSEGLDNLPRMKKKKNTGACICMINNVLHAMKKSK